MIETLESRRLFSGGPHPGNDMLSASDVSAILAQAASQAHPGQAIAITDRDGHVLGVFAMTGATQDTIDKAVTRARTGGLFESTQQTFSTRTARFIIQDHFPPAIRNTPGGPLYGVQFSDLPGSDILSADQVPAVSGDPGGLGLYKNKTPVGGIGVAGDGHDVAARVELKTSPDQPVYNGKEEKDFDESVALAGQKHFAPPSAITSNHIFLGGLRLPYVASKRAHGQPAQTLAQLETAGAGTVAEPIVDAPPSPYPIATFDGVPGQLKNPFAPDFGLLESNDPEPDHLTIADVTQIITDAVKQAKKTRSAIRLPTGVRAVVHISVVDRDGDLLGAFRMNSDGTNFSYDVSVQKARTAAFYSDDDHAFTTRAIGYMSQRFFPVGIDHSIAGPMFHVQDEISTQLDPSKPLPNGETIFPGGDPLYKDGHLVGGVGISGDGVDQDDLIAYAGTRGFRPADGIRSDQLSHAEIRAWIVSRMQVLKDNFVFSFDPVEQADTRLSEGLKDFRIPYVKFPRNPNI